jgi:hypothetical protein
MDEHVVAAARVLLERHAWTSILRRDQACRIVEILERLDPEDLPVQGEEWMSSLQLLIVRDRGDLLSLPGNPPPPPLTPSRRAP